MLTKDQIPKHLRQLADELELWKFYDKRKGTKQNKMPGRAVCSQQAAPYRRCHHTDSISGKPDAAVEFAFGAACSH
jgi:hypothetical protein